MKIPGNIETLDLMYNDMPAEFLFATMEEVDRESGGITDDPHRHSYYTIIWPTDAGGQHIIDFREYEIKNNHIFFVSPGQVHQVITTPAPKGYVIMFTPCFLERNSISCDFISDIRLFRNSDETPPLEVAGSRADKLKFYAEEMSASHEEYLTGGNQGLMLEKAGAFLKLFLIECNTECTLNNNGNTQNIQVEKIMVKKFKQLVEENFNRLHRVGEYASLMSVTPNYLNEVISDAVKVSAKEMIIQRVVLEAKRMVLFSGKSAKEIGFDLGFDDPSHFSRFFRNSAGVSMQEFKTRALGLNP